MDHDAFVDAVMNAAAIARDDAERAVRATLTEAVDDGEFFDVTVQLPQDYVSALIPART